MGRSRTAARRRACRGRTATCTTPPTRPAHRDRRVRALRRRPATEARAAPCRAPQSVAALELAGRFARGRRRRRHPAPADHEPGDEAEHDQHHERQQLVALDREEDEVDLEGPVVEDQEQENVEPEDRDRDGPPALKLRPRNAEARDVDLLQPVALHGTPSISARIPVMALRVAMLAPISWRVPPRHYGPWEQFVSLLTEGLVARGLDVTLFATADSETGARLVGSA